MVRWTRHAQTQLRHIHDYIATDSPLYARRVADALIRQTLVLDGLPRLGRVVPELGDENIRELPLYSYRIFYEICPDRIDVLAVIHKRRNLQAEDVVRES